MTAVQPLDPTPLGVASVRAALAAANADDPMMKWIFGGVESPDQALAAWLGLFVEAFAAAGAIDVVVDDDARPVATAMWRVDTTPLPYPEIPNLGGLLVSFLGADRAGQVGAGLGAFAAHKPEPPFHYLQFLAVHPGSQGRGLGRLLVAHGQQRAAAAGRGIYLESTNPRNLPFYASVGFQQLGGFTLEPDGPPAFRLWWAP